MDEKTEGALTLNRARSESYEAGYANGKAVAEAKAAQAAQADTATTPDAFDHDDCGCEVCQAIIDAIADTVDIPDHVQYAENVPEPEPEPEPEPKRDAIDVLIDATEGAMHYAWELEDAAQTAEEKRVEGVLRIAALEYALENALISMYAMRHDPLWFVAPDAARKDAALFALYMEGLNTLGHPLPGLGDDEPGEPA